MLIKGLPYNGYGRNIWCGSRGLTDPQIKFPTVIVGVRFRGNSSGWTVGVSQRCISFKTTAYRESQLQWFIIGIYRTRRTHWHQEHFRWEDGSCRVNGG